jgi:hypothetical protein
MHPIRASARYSRAIHSTVELLAKLRIESIFAGSVARGAWLGEEIESGSIDVIALMNAQQKNQLAMMAGNRGYRVERDEIEQSVELDLVPLNFIDAEGDVRVYVLLASNALYGRMVTAGELSALSSQLAGETAADELAARSSQLAGEMAEDVGSPASCELIAESFPESCELIADSAGELAAVSSQLSGETAEDLGSPASCELIADSSPASCELIAESFPESSIRVARAEDLALMLLMSEDHEAVRHLSELPGFDVEAFEQRLVSIGLGAQVVRS